MPVAPIPQAPPRIVPRDQWLAERRALLEQERALNHQRDAVAAARRALPWVKVEEDYVFEGPTGPRTLSDLFEGRSQLVVYHFMLTPGSDHICPGCSFMADHVDAARQHFEHADLAFAAISRAPISRIEEVRRRFGWRFAWLSSGANRFNFDYGVSFSPESVAAGGATYNYEPVTAYGSPDLPGMSVFAKDEAGQVFHTWSGYARAGDILLGALNWLDLTPKGRNETHTMSWLRLHDEYDQPPAPGGH